MDTKNTEDDMNITPKNPDADASNFETINCRLSPVSFGRCYCAGSQPRPIVPAAFDEFIQTLDLPDGNEVQNG